MYYGCPCLKYLSQSRTFLLLLKLICKSWIIKMLELYYSIISCTLVLSLHHEFELQNYVQYSCILYMFFCIWCMDLIVWFRFALKIMCRIVRTISCLMFTEHQRYTVHDLYDRVNWTIYVRVKFQSTPKTWRKLYNSCLMFRGTPRNVYICIIKLYIVYCTFSMFG